MAWSAPMTAVANTALTAAQWNQHVRDNFLETAPAKASAAGGYFVSVGANSIVQRTGASDSVLQQDTTTSTAYDDLANNGPVVSVTTGPTALVIVGAQMGQTTTAAASARMSYEVSGATAIEASDQRAAGKIGGTTDLYVISGHAFLQTGLTPGANTFTAKYRVSSGTGTFQYRTLSVVPF